MLSRPVLASLSLALAVSVPLIAMGAPASASCGTGAFPTAEVSGVVVSTSIDPDSGVVVALQADDGSTKTVRFGGRNPSNTQPDGSENTVEDAWAGDLPQVGGRYTITGAQFEGSDGPVDVSNCAQAASVEQLAAPLATDAATTAPAAEAGAAGSSATAMIAVIAGTVVGVGALAVVLRRRRTIRESG